MSKRILRTVPATLLVTTALSWNLPAAAQAVTGSPGATTPGTSQKAPPAAANNRAPAAGEVAAARDGMADVSIRDSGQAAVQGRECGNGVRVRHADGGQPISWRNM